MNASRKSLLCAAALIVLLGGCEQTKQLLGQTKEGPDEFAVYSRAPLSLPPDYSLRPPAPGAPRPQAVNPRDRARQALFGGRTTGARPAPVPGAGAGTPSRGELAILRRTGALNADPEIRRTINRETSFLADEDKTITDRIIFWGVPTQYGTAVDATAETRRIRENQALGNPLTTGDVPTIKRKRRAIFEGLFK